MTTEAPELSDLTVMVVEDDQQMLELIGALLARLGIDQVVKTTDGEQAKQRLLDDDEAPIDLVISDLRMRPMSGGDLVGWIRNGEDTPNRYLPVILLTGHAELNRIIQLRDLGVNEVLTKPITINNLSRKILTVVERPRRFVDAGNYFGPDRRRRDLPFGGRDRRTPRDR